MKFGVREVCNVVFRAKTAQYIGGTFFEKHQPVLYIDTATTSTVEGAATTVYAQGGRGNTRLMSWEGEKTLTFTVEDALLSPIGFAVLSGAGIIHAKNAEDAEVVHVHTTTAAMMEVKDGTATIDLSDALSPSDKICKDAPIFVIKTEEGDGSLTGTYFADFTVDGQTLTSTGGANGDTLNHAASTPSENGSYSVFVDYFILRTTADTYEMQIDAESFAGYYYVEADTLFRRQDNGKDMPANLIFPNVKIQSNFTFTMASTGDPSTFTFTMDAFPGYTMFDKTKKVLCVMQVIDESIAGVEQNKKTVLGDDGHGHVAEDILGEDAVLEEEHIYDSVPGGSSVEEP